MFEFLPNDEEYMSRIKIILLILIIAVLAIVFVQNREPISLKFLCGYEASFCPKSIPLPLAVWIGLFTLMGAIANLLVQTLNNYGYQDSGKQKLPLDDDLYPSNRNRQRKTSRKHQSSTSTIDLQDSLVRDKFPDENSYEIKQEPQNVERSGSTYSYKYREAGDRPNNYQERTKKTSTESEINSSEINSNITPEQDDEDWI